LESVLGATPQEFESLILRQEAFRPGYGVTKVHFSDELWVSLPTVTMGPPSKVALSTSLVPTFRHQPGGEFPSKTHFWLAAPVAVARIMW
jgi:hypothetical protein